MQPSVRIELFGGLRIVHDSQIYDRFPSVRSAALIAYLACYPDHPHLREALIVLLWPDTDLDTGRVRLRTVLTEARRLLEPGQTPHGSILRADRASIRLQTDQVAVDATDLRHCLLQAERGVFLDKRVSLLTRVVDLYCGELLPGFYDDWVLREREHYHHLFIKALRDLAQCYEQAGQLDLAIGVLRDLLRKNPLSDEANHELVRLLMKSGQIAAAHAQFQAQERLLRAEFGIEPLAATRALLLERASEVICLSPGFTTNSFPASDQSGPPAATDAADSPAPMVELPKGRDSSLPSYRPRMLMAGAFVVLSILIFATFQLPLDSTYRSRMPKSGSVPARAPAWETRYSSHIGETDSESTAITTDPLGNIYVAGFVQTASHKTDFLTAKYDRDGQQLWVRRYNGPGNGVDQARSIALDKDGNVYVTGDSDNGRGARDNPQSGLDIATLKYSPTGELLWCRRFNGAANGEDVPCKVVTSNDGGIYVGGYSYGGKTNFDYIVLRYTPDGQLSWARRYDGGTGEEDRLVDLAAFPQGGVCVTGFAHGGVKVGVDVDYLTLRYDVHGDIQWVGRYVSEHGGNDLARCLAVDPAGNVYVTGSASYRGMARGAASEKMVTVKYDPNGVQKWVRQYTGPKGESDIGRALAVDAAGDVVVIGVSYDPSGSVKGFLTKYRPSGDVSWTGYYDDLCTRNDTMLSMAIDTHCNIVVMGRTSHTSGKESLENISVMQCTSEGDPLWLHRYNGLANGAAIGTAITTDAFGDPILTGQSDTGTAREIILVKYGSS